MPSGAHPRCLCIVMIPQILLFYVHVYHAIPQIKEIDDGLLKFSNLKELTLTGNLLKHINPYHLPRELEVHISMPIYLHI